MRGDNQPPPGGTTMARVTVSERQDPVLLTHGADVDSAPGVCKGVVLCGLESAHGRTYPREVFKKRVGLYANAPVFLDHADDRSQSRSVKQWFGEIRAVRLRADGRPEGDLHYPTSHSFAEEFKTRAKHFPKSLG